MYQILIYSHSVIRWFVVISILYSVYRAYRGYASGAVFSKTDNSTRHWTATIAHIQLITGIVLFTQSPSVKYFWNNFSAAVKVKEALFFGLIHIALMLVGIVILTIGSSLSKRRSTDREKFKTMLVWFSIALLIIFIAVPWPFSPLATRPYLRTF